MTEKQAKTRGMKKCNHIWFYVHSIWEAKRNDPSAVAVGRCCWDCGKMETAVAKDWHPLPKSYVDMREVLKEEASHE